MRKCLTDVDSEFLSFLRYVLTWLIQPRVARLFKSLDDNIKRKFEVSSRAMESRIDEMWKGSGKSQMAITWDVQDDVQ
jgi:hypothetical protein